MSTARTGSGRGRPVAWASAASMTGALPVAAGELGGKGHHLGRLTSSRPARQGSGRRRSSRLRSWRRQKLACRAPLEGADAADVPGVTGQLLGLSWRIPVTASSTGDRGARGQVAADEAARARRIPTGRRRVSGQAPAKLVTKFLRTGRPGQGGT